MNAISFLKLKQFEYLHNVCLLSQSEAKSIVNKTRYSETNVDNIAKMIVDFVGFMDGFASKCYYHTKIEKRLQVFGCYEGAYFCVDVQVPGQATTVTQEAGRLKIQCAQGHYAMVYTFNDFYQWFNTEFIKK